jgi:hypothetical protein
VSNTDRAQQNREYVRRLLSKKQPGFAAVLERVVWELTRTCDALSAESPECEHGTEHGPECQPVVQGRSLSGLSTAQMCLIRSPATSNASTDTVTPSS